jgi:5-methylcytosine-specific restriction enzyme subunit McrC
LLELADVSDHSVTVDDFDEVRFDRGSERFRDLIEFCRLLFLGTTPSAEIGHKSSFSMLFPMEVLFEEFVGGCLKKFATAFGYSRSHVHLQSKSSRRWLLRDVANQGKFRLKPDVLINHENGLPRLILDTKWKRLLSDDIDTKNGVHQGDMYQLYAYATRYKCRNNILLFPRMAGVTPKSYTVEGLPQTHLRVDFLDLNYDLRLNRAGLLADLKRILDFETSETLVV